MVLIEWGFERWKDRLGLICYLGFVCLGWGAFLAFFAFLFILFFCFFVLFFCFFS